LVENGDGKGNTLIDMEPSPIIRNYVKMCYNNFNVSYWDAMDNDVLKKRLKATIFDDIDLKLFKKNIKSNLKKLEDEFKFEYNIPNPIKNMPSIGKGVINYKCELLNSYSYYPTDIYDLDHKDGDHFHNYTSNIISICKICHGIKTKLQNDKGIKSENYFTGLLISNILTISNKNQTVYDYIIKRVVARRTFIRDFIVVEDKFEDDKDDIRKYYDYYYYDKGIKDFINKQVQEVIDIKFSNTKIWKKDNLQAMLIEVTQNIIFVKDYSDLLVNNNISDVQNDNISAKTIKTILNDKRVLDLIKSTQDLLDKYYELSG